MQEHRTALVIRDGRAVENSAVVAASLDAILAPVIGAWLATPAVVRPFPAALTGQDVIAS